MDLMAGAEAGCFLTPSCCNSLPAFIGSGCLVETPTLPVIVLCCCLCSCVVQGESELLQKYNKSHLDSYIEDSTRVTYCPSVPWCGRAIEVSLVGQH